MIINKKIQAFTLSEMIVVLILTSIVVGLAFSALSIIQKHMFAIQENYNRNLELNKLKTVLWLDFNRYSKVNYDVLEDELKFKNELDSISYKFTEQNIIREQQDTFSVQLENKLFYFDGVLSKSNQIDAIKLRTNKSYQNQELFIFKNNDATEYIE